MSVEEIKEKLLSKRKYHKSSLQAYEGELIMTGSVKVRLNALKDRERVALCNEMIEFIESDKPIV